VTHEPPSGWPDLADPSGEPAADPIQCQAFPLLRLRFSRLGRGTPAENFFLYPTVDRLQDEVRLRPRERAHDPDTAP
jgi:hypothetical protein